MPLLSKDSRKDGNIITVNGYSSKKNEENGDIAEFWKVSNMNIKLPMIFDLLKCWWRREMLKKKNFWVRIIKCLLLKYVNRILRRICHANRLLDKCLLEPSMMEVIRSVLRRVRRRNPPILSDFKSRMNCTKRALLIKCSWLFFIYCRLIYYILCSKLIEI